MDRNTDMIPALIGCSDTRNSPAIFVPWATAGDPLRKTKWVTSGAGSCYVILSVATSPRLMESACWNLAVGSEKLRKSSGHWAYNTWESIYRNWHLRRQGGASPKVSSFRQTSLATDLTGLSI